MFIFTVIPHFEVILLPSVVVVVISQLPFPTGVTFPVLSTVATLVLLLFHKTVLLALLGVTATIKLSELFVFFMFIFPVFPLFHVILLLSAVVVVISHIPFPTGVTFPVLSTFA